MVENHQKRLHLCTCQQCQQRPLGETAALHSSINRVLVILNEKSRRRFAGLLAMQGGYGGVQYFARVTGLSRTTILRGQREIELADAAGESRIRVAGGGRLLFEKNNRKSQLRSTR